MEYKIDATEYLISAITEVEREFKDLQVKINAVRNERSYNKAAAYFMHVHGMVAGIYWVVNSMENCETNEVLQDVLEKWEERLQDREELLKAMKKGYVAEEEEA